MIMYIKAGVVWGLADNFQGIWDDTKNVARELGLSLQVPYGAPNKGEAAESQGHHVVQRQSVVKPGHSNRCLARQPSQKVDQPPNRVTVWSGYKVF